jgi:hypothetical protein
MIVNDIGAEKKHAPSVVADLRETQDFREKTPGLFEILYVQDQMADSFDFK